MNDNTPPTDFQTKIAQILVGFARMETLIKSQADNAVAQAECFCEVMMLVADIVKEVEDA